MHKYLGDFRLSVYDVQQPFTKMVNSAFKTVVICAALIGGAVAQTAGQYGQVSCSLRLFDLPC